MASGVDTDEVSVMEGDSVTLNTGVKKPQQDRIRWDFNDIRIAQISGDLSFICTDVQCNEDTERFRDRLKLDPQTGSLTITNIRNTDSGEYHLLINNIEKIFHVSVHGVSAADQEMERKTVKEGESLTLDPGVTKKPTGSMTWRFKDTLTLAEITRDESKICTDDQCKERFRDRLKLDHQTGSLTITNTRNTDSGLYKLQISSGSSRRHRRSISRVKNFEVSVTGSGLSPAVPGSGLSLAVPGSDLSSGVVAGGVSVVLLGLAAVAAAVIYLWRRIFRNDGERQNTPNPSTEELMGESENERKHDEML